MGNGGFVKGYAELAYASDPQNTFKSQIIILVTVRLFFSTVLSVQ